jgi:polyhydroxyalkanoate synthesis regulator protein
MPFRIVKYENRKLYDSETAKYVSMLELSDLVVERGEVIVISDRTGKDITLQTLCHALYARLKTVVNDESGNPPFLPSELIALIKQTPRRSRRR